VLYLPEYIIKGGSAKDVAAAETPDEPAVVTAAGLRNTIGDLQARVLQLEEESGAKPLEDVAAGDAVPITELHGDNGIVVSRYGKGAVISNDAYGAYGGMWEVTVDDSGDGKVTCAGGWAYFGGTGWVQVAERAMTTAWNTSGENWAIIFYNFTAPEDPMAMTRTVESDWPPAFVDGTIPVAIAKLVSNQTGGIVDIVQWKREPIFLPFAVA